MMTRNPRTWPWSGLAIAAGWAVSILGTVWAVFADRATVKNTIDTNSHTIADHETRLRSIEPRLAEIARDVRWIRDALDTPKPTN